MYTEIKSIFSEESINMDITVMNNYYIQTNLICILLLCAVYIVLHNRKGALSTRRRSFTRLLIVTSFICLSDVFAWFFNNQPVAVSEYFIHACNMIYDAAITWACYQWLDYVCLRTNAIEHNHKKRKILSSIPLIAMLAIIATNPLTKLLFSVTFDEADGLWKYQRGSALFIHWIISWGYLIAATVIVIRQIRRTESKSAKKKLRPVLLFAAPPAVAAIVQMIFYGVTAMQCGITFAIIIITFGYMNEEISRDDLTDLNNRAALEYYANDKLQKSECHILVLMCDIDRFKTINDTMGHAMGDVALKKVADVLKAACTDTDSHVFLCRYGGDEFVICGSDISDDEVEKLKDDIGAKLSEVNDNGGFGVPITVSVGKSAGICTTYDDVEKLISIADEEMYLVKRAAQKQRD